VKFFGKKYFILVTGLLFVTSVSLDPLYHAFFQGESTQIECQFCKNEVPGTIRTNLGIDKVSLSEILKVEINENFISFNHNSYYSRAPPK
jgi:hypothetical protein